MSASGHKQTLCGAATARAAGCDGYMPEPYSPRQLLAKIQQCMYGTLVKDLTVL
jgi:CheY-like chemotaxis protein